MEPQLVLQNGTLTDKQPQIWDLRHGKSVRGKKPEQICYGNLQKQTVQHSISQVWSVEHWFQGMLIVAKWAKGFHGQTKLSISYRRL